MIYLRLIKWRLSLAVAFSSAAGYFLAAEEFDARVLISTFAVFLLSGGAAGLNQIQERQFDKVMSRTTSRPIPAGELNFLQALTFSLLCIITGSILLFRIHWLPASLGLLNILIYNGLYTPLKRKTIYALLPGGLVGALPPLIGWTSAGGQPFHPTILYLATLLFLWQIPHFWLLVIRHGKEYEKAGFQSISLYLSEKQIKRLVLYWMVISSIFLASYRIFGIRVDWWIGAIILTVNVVLIWMFYRYLFKMNHARGTKIAFIMMNVFLSLVLLGLVVNSLIF